LPNQNQLIKKKHIIVLKLLYNYFQSKLSKKEKSFFILNSSSCQKAHLILKTDMDIKQRWSQAVRWLHEQLEVSQILEFLFFSIFSLAII
jgi:hypothetical protein